MQLAEITPVLTTTRHVSYNNYIIQTSVVYNASLELHQ